MVRPVYSHELTDPDFAWLLTSFSEEFPGFFLVDTPGAPVVLIRCEASLQASKVNEVLEAVTSAPPHETVEDEA